MGREKTDTDLLVRQYITDAKPDSIIWEGGGGTPELRKALKGGSKSATPSGYGEPDFMFFSKGHLVVIEDKARINRLKYLNENDEIDLKYPYRNQYAVNGALHYAIHIMNNSNKFKGVFAIGVAGDKTHLESEAFYVKKDEIIPLPSTENFQEYAPENIDEFYKVSVCGDLPKSERDLREVKKIASSLHEDMRNYGSLEGERKATTVSAILLALQNPDFNIKMLKGASGENQNDGYKIFRYAKEFLDAKYEDDENGNQKRGAIEDQFAFLRGAPQLNKRMPELGNNTPLHKFAETLQADVLDHITKNTSFDILGNFYGEFVRYGGSDGNSLGIVLTPHHITTLMAELIEVGKDDYVIDPCAGTAAFLIAAMNRMIASADGDEAKIASIKANQLHGIEQQDKLYAVGATNMILRGDGRARFRRDNMMDIDLETLRSSNIKGQIVEHGFTRCLMNPPYSQGKNKETAHLKEIRFIERALNMLNQNGRLAVIVPQSTMVSSKGHGTVKKAILAKHTLDAVITLNKDTFYGVGTNPVIALFTAGVPHPTNKKVSLINFKDDGMIVRPHTGLISDGTDQVKREHLLNVLRGNEDDGENFIIKTTVKHEDDWLHSYFYFNDIIPEDKDFDSVITDFLTFEMNMLMQGKDYLFAEKPETIDGDKDVDNS